MSSSSFGRGNFPLLTFSFFSRMQQQGQILLLQQIGEEPPIKPIIQEEQEQKEQEEVTIIVNKGVCIKEHRLVSQSVYKIQHNVWYNRARRRFKKASYFSEKA
jgi:hypothetical protein